MRHLLFSFLAVQLLSVSAGAWSVGGEATGRARAYIESVESQRSTPIAPADRRKIYELMDWAHRVPGWEHVGILVAAPGLMGDDPQNPVLTGGLYEGRSLTLAATSASDADGVYNTSESTANGNWAGSSYADLVVTQYDEFAFAAALVTRPGSKDMRFGVSNTAFDRRFNLYTSAARLRNINNQTISSQPLADGANSVAVTVSAEDIGGGLNEDTMTWALNGVLSGETVSDAPNNWSNSGAPDTAWHSFVYYNSGTDRTSLTLIAWVVVDEPLSPADLSALSALLKRLFID